MNIDEYTSWLQQHSTGGPDVAGSMLFQGHGGSAMEKIHEQAWAVVQPIFQETRESAWNRFHDLAGSESATDDIGEMSSRRMRTSNVQLFLIRNRK